MEIINIITGLGLFAVFAYIAYTFISDFLGQKGTTWQRLLSAGKDSATILWARFSLMVGTLSGALVELATYVGAPGVADGIKDALQPQYVLGFVILSSIITEWARRRTL